MRSWNWSSRAKLKTIPRSTAKRLLEGLAMLTYTEKQFNEKLEHEYKMLQVLDALLNVLPLCCSYAETMEINPLPLLSARVMAAYNSEGGLAAGSLYVSSVRYLFKIFDLLAIA